MKRKVLYVLLSAVIACGMWLYVITTDNPDSEETFYNIPVVLQNESVLTERALMLSLDKDPTVTLKLSGSRSSLNKLNSSNITITADLSKVYTAGKQTISYTITFPGDIPSNSIEVISRSPSEVTITVVERKTKEVPVEIEYVGSVPDGYRTDKENITLSTEYIYVTGPAEELEDITKARITVDLDGRTESISEVYTYVLCNDDGESIESDTLSVDTEEVTVVLTIQPYKDVELTLTVVPGGGATTDNTTITMDTDTIRISGTEQLLEDVGDTLNLGTLDLGQIEENTTIEYAIRLSDGITNLTGQDTVTVTVDFGELVTKQLRITNFEAVNVPEEYTVSIVTRVMTVTFRGSAEEIEALTADDVVIQVDFSSAEIGSDSYKALAWLDSQQFSTVGAIGSLTVDADVEYYVTDATEEETGG
ncbi:MAG: hypothetical protein LUH51_05485 [Firmicutes bacterium]|nr:hypothetical protein [Bacillota bacterium]